MGRATGKDTSPAGKTRLNKGGGRLWEFYFFGNHFFALQTSKNAMKHMILSFKMKGDDVVADHFLML